MTDKPTSNHFTTTVYLIREYVKEIAGSEDKPGFEACWSLEYVAYYFPGDGTEIRSLRQARLDK